MSETYELLPAHHNYVLVHVTSGKAVGVVVGSDAYDWRALPNGTIHRADGDAPRFDDRRPAPGRTPEDALEHYELWIHAAEHEPERLIEIGEAVDLLLPPLEWVRKMHPEV